MTKDVTFYNNFIPDKLYPLNISNVLKDNKKIEQLNFNSDKKLKLLWQHTLKHCFVNFINLTDKFVTILHKKTYGQLIFRIRNIKFPFEIVTRKNKCLFKKYIYNSKLSKPVIAAEIYRFIQQ